MSSRHVKRSIVLRVTDNRRVSYHQNVLTMLGGPMERMESWGPPGRNKRRPCKVTVSTSLGGVKYTPCLGSPENYHATD